MRQINALCLYHFARYMRIYRTIVYPYRHSLKNLFEVGIEGKLVWLIDFTIFDDLIFGLSLYLLIWTFTTAYFN